MKVSVMKIGLLVSLVFFLIACNSTATRLLLHRDGSRDEVVDAEIVPRMQVEEDGGEDLNSLMEMELGGCSDSKGDDEDCWSRRRMIVEAHLDYIYTQHHKP